MSAARRRPDRGPGPVPDCLWCGDWFGELAVMMMMKMMMMMVMVVMMLMLMWCVCRRCSARRGPPT
jgi:uncharacterized membrane protein